MVCRNFWQSASSHMVAEAWQDAANNVLLLRPQYKPQLQDSCPTKRPQLSALYTWCNTSDIGHLRLLQQYACTCMQVHRAVARGLTMPGGATCCSSDAL